MAGKDVPSASSVIPHNIVTRQDFPLHFKFGCSTSALQTEGFGNGGGRGASTWDSMIQDGMAVDSYHRYKEDVQLLKAMGADTYRFSIAWPRILPQGTVTGGINQEGIEFYNNFINELLKYGITPFVTLFHFDLPQALQDNYNGFLNSQIVDDFKAYADICYKNFGDRVKHWVTINEPQIFGQFGYSIGLNDPDVNPVTDPFLATHNIILAHSAAAKLYKDTYQATQQGEVGISLVTQWFEPYDNTRQNKDAAKRALEFLIGWILEPMVYGDYPFIMKALVRDALPTFTEEEKSLVKGSLDFIGVNYYTSRYATALPLDANQSYTSQDQYQRVDITVDRNDKPIGELAPGSTAGPNGIYLYPQGLRDALIYISKGYGNPKIYITENGYPEKRDDTIPVEIAQEDDARIRNILRHLHAISQAIKLGVNVKGYLMWSLMDCLEVGSGYQVRFGLNYTDYLNNLNRIPKKSARWLRSFVGLGQSQ
ncbi:hypothetical protein LguiA_016972 [Lonicera macranthoides]